METRSRYLPFILPPTHDLAHLFTVLDHVPLVGVGSRIFRCFDLPFVRYDIPPPLPSPSPSPSPSSHHASSTPHTLYHPTFRPRTPVLRYNLSTPVLPIGPSDYVFTSIHLRPLNPAVSIRSATVIIERRIDLHHVTPTSHTFTVHAPDLPPEDPQPPSPIPSRFRSSRSTRPSTTSTLPISVSSSMPESSAVPRRSPYSFTPNHSSSTIDTAPPTPSASTYTITSPLLPPPPPTPHLPSPSTPVDAPSKSLTSIIAYADSGVGGFAVDHASGVWSKTVSIQWPKPRSHHHWAQGETSRSDLANVTFWVRVKVSSPPLVTLLVTLHPFSPSDPLRSFSLPLLLAPNLWIWSPKRSSSSPQTIQIADWPSPSLLNRRILPPKESVQSPSLQGAPGSRGAILMENLRLFPLTTTGNRAQANIHNAILPHPPVRHHPSRLRHSHRHIRNLRLARNLLPRK